MCILIFPSKIWAKKCTLWVKVYNAHFFYIATYGILQIHLHFNGGFSGKEHKWLSVMVIFCGIDSCMREVLNLILTSNVRNQLIITHKARLFCIHIIWPGMFTSPSSRTVWSMQFFPADRAFQLLYFDTSTRDKPLSLMFPFTKWLCS